MFFTIKGNLTIRLPENLINDTVKELVFGLLYRSVNVDYVPHKYNEIIIGEAERKTYIGESVYIVTEKGIYIGGKDERALLTALFMLLQDAEPVDLEKGKEHVRFLCTEKQIDTGIKRRMIHFCVFPKISLSVYKKFIGLAGVLGFTHIILEFFGTLKFDALKELSWENFAFTKGEIADLIKEMRDLKIEPIPMFNHFGHAAQSGLLGGKHVVLDRNPRLATLFSPDGWRWEFDKPEVKDLLKKIRLELIDLFGDGKYFHVGFDESFSYPNDEKSTDALCKYITYLCEEVKSEGRIPLLWGDLFLHEPTVGINKETGYEGNCPSASVAEKMIKSLPDYAVICDWQYFVKKAPWKSAKYFKDKGVKTIVCPYYDPEGVTTAIETVQEYSCYAYMQTTWDRPFTHGGLIPLIEPYYKIFGIDKAVPKVDNCLNSATLIRKLFFAEGDYDKSGFDMR